MAKKIMIQGTSSNVGKSILTAALCRIFKEDGYKTAPFKAQNMALNSYVTEDGGEISRSIAVQAEAAGEVPSVDMNPILLKPVHNSGSQVIIHGKDCGVISAKEYHEKTSKEKFAKVQESFERLDQSYDVIVIEGAGSPAEINLKANDIVNMKMAKYANSRVLLVADIDRGGALASIVGTLALLEPEEQDLVAGIVINKFRGDISLLKPALDYIEEKTGKPVLGVIPYMENHGIEEEDSVSLEEKNELRDFDLDIAIVQLPKIANFSDYKSLSLEKRVRVRYVHETDDLSGIDLLIVPDSKNPEEDLKYLVSSGFAGQIQKIYSQGTPIIGIGGGYQMLGKEFISFSEGKEEILPGLGILAIRTELDAEPVVRQIEVFTKDQPFLGAPFGSFEQIQCYEVRTGKVKILSEDSAAFYYFENGTPVKEGVIHSTGQVLGTNMHGFLDHDGYRERLLRVLRAQKGIGMPEESKMSYQSQKEKQFHMLAQVVRQNMDIEQIKQRFLR